MSARRFFIAIFSEPDAVSHWDEDGFGYYRRGQLQAVRARQWKLYLPLEKKLMNNATKTSPTPVAAELYDVRDDLHEDHEVSALHPDVVKRLAALAEKIRGEIGDDDKPGSGQRPAGHVDDPVPLLLQATKAAR